MPKIIELKSETATGNPMAEEITDKRGMARRWKLSPRTIDSFIQKGMPAVRIGTRRVRLVVRECDQWMMEQYSSRARR